MTGEPVTGAAVVATEAPRPAAEKRDILVAEKVTRRFGGLVAVNEIDFTIPEGSIVSLIGPNGAGKTTFFNVLLGIIDPSSGKIEFNGRAMIARPRRIGLESVVWVLPSVIVLLLGILLSNLGFASAMVPAVLVCIGFLVTTLLLAIVRPQSYVDFLLRLGIFRSARPNDMVAAGVGRTFQNIRLFQNMTALENVLVGMHSKMDSTPVDAFFSTRHARSEEGATDNAAQDLLRLVGLRGIGNELAKNLPVRRPAPARDRARARLGPQAPAARRAGGRHEPQGDRRPDAPDLAAAPRPGPHDPAHRARHEARHGHQRPGHGPRRGTQDRRGHAG